LVHLRIAPQNPKTPLQRLTYTFLNDNKHILLF